MRAFGPLAIVLLLGTGAAAQQSGGGGGGGGGPSTATGVGVQTGQNPQAIGDDNTALPAGHYVYTTNAVLTAARTKALPASSAQGVGDLLVIDAFQGVSATNTLTLCATGSDTINGGPAAGCAPAIAVIGGGIGFHNNGAGAWTVTWNTLLGTSSAPANQFATGLSTSGLTYAQPSFANLSGTSGVGQLANPGTWTAAQTFNNVIGKVTTTAATTYTLAATDCGTTISFTAATGITLTTLNTMPIGCVVAVEQAAAGQVTVTAGAGSSFISASAYTKTRTQWSVIGLRVDSNAGGTAAHYVFVGDGA